MNAQTRLLMDSIILLYLNNHNKQIMKDSSIRFFLKNKDSLAEYIGKIKVNTEKTLVKFGNVEGDHISINFFTYHELDETITDFEEKIKQLFNSKEDLSILDGLIEQINTPCKFTFSPYLKISKENEILIYAFQITIYFEK